MQIIADHPTRRAENGFTLIEVMMALAIFSIGVLAVFAMQTNSMGRSSSAVKSNQAGFWAQDIAEKLLRLPYNDARLNTVSSVAGGLINQQIEGPYTVTWAVFSSAENSAKINDFAAIRNNPMFAKVNKTNTLANLSANSKMVMVHVSHPLGQEARVVFIKPNF